MFVLVKGMTLVKTEEKEKLANAAWVTLARTTKAGKKCLRNTNQVKPL